MTYLPPRWGIPKTNVQQTQPVWRTPINIKFEQHGSLAIAPDKGFVIASAPTIAAVAAALRTLLVQPDVVVRRFGLDYHLEL
jgi:hypothetical protein